MARDYVIVRSRESGRGVHTSCQRFTGLTMSGRTGDLSEEQHKALIAFKSEITQEFVSDDVRNYLITLFMLIIDTLIGDVFEIPACAEICSNRRLEVRENSQKQSLYFVICVMQAVQRNVSVAKSK